MADPVDATLPKDSDLASTWPALMRETRALFNSLLSGNFAFTDATTGKKAYLTAEYQGTDDNGDDIWTLKFSAVPPQQT